MEYVSTAARTFRCGCGSPGKPLELAKPGFVTSVYRATPGNGEAGAEELKALRALARDDAQEERAPGLQNDA